MSCELPRAVLNYLEAVEADTPRACPEQHALAAHIRKCFADEDIHVDTEQLRRYLSLSRYFPYKQLFSWQEFLIALWDCTYTAEGRPRWKTLFSMVGRGAGKDGLIAFDSMCSVSPYNPVKHYNVDICANNEEQAMTPVLDLVATLESPDHEKKLKRFFYHTKELVQGRETSNGEINDGPLDDYLARGRRILFEGEPDNGFLPFICCLKDREQVHDPDNWYMANPSLIYLPDLYQETADEYRDWVEHPEQNGDFLTKRMGLRAGYQEISVTDYEKILATNQPVPDLQGWTCTVGIDYAELSDWAGINLHFRRGADRFDINHAWVCLKSKTLPRVKAPWQAWAKAGHLTAVDDVSINPDLLAAYIQDAARRYNIKALAMDHYRWTLVSESMRAVGFDAADKSRVKLVRPSDIMQVEPVIQECFDRQLFHWGDNPCLRWSVNNTKRVRSSRKLGVDTGNFIYAKIEAKSRKTDPFMALAASMTIEPLLGTGTPLAVPIMGAIRL